MTPESANSGRSNNAGCGESDSVSGSDTSNFLSLAGGPS